MVSTELFREKMIHRYVWEGHFPVGIDKAAKRHEHGRCLICNEQLVIRKHSISQQVMTDPTVYTHKDEITRDKEYSICMKCDTGIKIEEVIYKRHDEIITNISKYLKYNVLPADSFQFDVVARGEGKKACVFCNRAITAVNLGK
jgi:hypothetical protein